MTDKDAWLARVRDVEAAYRNWDAVWPEVWPAIDALPHIPDWPWPK